MNNSPQMKVYGRVDLDGTHRAIIETTHPSLIPTQQTQNAPFVRLNNNRKTCGCIVSQISELPHNRIFIDRYKLWHLGVKDGDLIDVSLFTPAPASKIEIQTSEDVSDRDSIRFIGKPVCSGEKTALFTFSGEPRLFKIAGTTPPEISLVTPATEIKIASSDPQSAPISYGDIGGLTREIKLIREVVEYPLRFGEAFVHLGVTPPKGIILHGPPGTGKTLIARALANSVGASFYSISGPEVYSKWYGKSEQTLRNIFLEAVKNAPSIVVIDEIDALVPRRDKTHGDQEQRIVATFLTQMDGLKEMRDVVVVGTTNRIDSMDPALRRGGRFEHEVFIGLPDATGREEILKVHTRKMPLDSSVNTTILAEKTIGFVGADLSSLCREAAYNALRRETPEQQLSNLGDSIDVEKILVNQKDFEIALTTVPPSASRELALDVPKVSWEDVGGLDSIKQLLIENIDLSNSHKDAFAKAGVKPAKGILLYGPPGTGKTLLARAIACECAVNFIAIKGSELRQKWLGESEGQVKFLFARAKLLSPCVIFFDEVDSAIPRRGRDVTGTTDSIVNQILSEMNGIQDMDGVFVIGATNRIDHIDPAALRPGRFDYQIEVPLPDENSRESIFKVHLKNKPIDADISIQQLVHITKGFNGAQVAEVCREAAWNALRECHYDCEKLQLTQSHMLTAVDRIARAIELQLPQNEAK